MTPTLTASQHKKSLGAFYTDERVVEFLTRWGLSRQRKTVMDPSCGDGRFLEAAARAGASRLLGFDVSPEAITATRARLTELGLDAELTHADFFSVAPSSVDPVHLMIGNPPFIRYQKFTGRSREAALASAFRLGIRLSRLTSTWAPFLVHGVQFLEPGGRLAMVVPAEASQTRYGLKTLKALTGHFNKVHLLTFEENFFEDAQVETYLLLADGYGGACDSLQLLPLGTIEELASLQIDHEAARGSSGRFIALDNGSDARVAEAHITPRQRATWARIRRHPAVRSVASLAEVTNGYVTGDNDFFHRSQEDARAAGLPATWLLPTARSSRSLAGLFFDPADIQKLDRGGVAHHLVLPQEDLFSEPEPLERFKAEGEAKGTPDRFKCRTRTPWWRVPGLQRADLLVGYMSGAFPRAVVNRAGAYYCNSLHGLRLRGDVPPEFLALALYSSLALLSLELEGRSYGGGILKIEPRELDRVLVPCPALPQNQLAPLSREVDELLRSGQYAEATSRVDEALLVKGLGLSKTAVSHLRAARERLASRRASRGKRKRG